MYALMTGKTWTRLHLLNPFQNSKESYYFDTKAILTLRKELIKDVLCWNLNCYMAKTYPECKNNEKIDLMSKGTLFLNIVKDEKGNVTQASIINMLSPIKCQYIYSKYVSSEKKKEKTFSKEERFACESKVTKKELIQEVKTILNSEMNKNKNIWSFEKHEDMRTDIISIKEKHKLESFDDIVKDLEYSKNTELAYSADLQDSFVKNIFSIAYIFTKSRFV
jgi:hypothetical protein